MRSSQHEPTTDLERHAVTDRVTFDEPCRRLARLPGVRWHATEHPLHLLQTGMQATWRIVCAGERCTAPSIRPSCAENSNASGCWWRTPSTSVRGAATASSVSAVAETATSYTRVRSDSEAVVRTATPSSCSPICLDRRCSPHPAWPECHRSVSQLAGQTN